MDLDISQNINLTKLDCGNTKITSLDITKNVSLEGLEFIDNMLTILDVSKNENLGRLLLWSYVDILPNPPVTCIKVNIFQYYNISSGWEKDSNDKYSLNCN